MSEQNKSRSGAYPALVASLKKNVIRYRIHLNALSMAFIRPFTLLVNIIVAPIYLKYLGQDLYGIYAFFITFASRIIILDFGMQTLLIKEFALLRQGAQHHHVRLLRQAVLMYAVIGAGFAIVCLAVGWLSGIILHVPENFRTQALHLSWLAAGCSFWMVLFRPLEAILDGMELQVIRNLPPLVSGLVSVGLAVMVWFHKVPQTVFFALSFTIFIVPGFWKTFVLTRLGVWKVLASAGEDTGKYSRMGEAFHASWPIFLNQIVSLVQQEAPNFLTGWFTGPAGLAIYNLAQRPVYCIRILTAQMALAFMPRAVQLHEKKDHGALLAFVRKPAIMVCTISLSMAFAYTAGAAPFLQLWLRKSPVSWDQVLWPSLLAAYIYGCAACSAVSGRFLTYIGHANKLNRITLFWVLAGVPAAAVVGSFAGLNGILTVMLGQSLGLAMSINSAFYRIIEVPKHSLFGADFCRHMFWLAAVAFVFLFLLVAWNAPWLFMGLAWLPYVAVLGFMLLHQWRKFKLGDL